MFLSTAFTSRFSWIITQAPVTSFKVCCRFKLSPLSILPLLSPKHLTSIELDNKPHRSPEYPNELPSVYHSTHQTDIYELIRGRLLIAARHQLTIKALWLYLRRPIKGTKYWKWSREHACPTKGRQKGPQRMIEFDQQEVLMFPSWKKPTTVC